MPTRPEPTVVRKEETDAVAGSFFLEFDRPSTTKPIKVLSLMLQLSQENYFAQYRFLMKPMDLPSFGFPDGAGKVGVGLYAQWNGELNWPLGYKVRAHIFTNVNATIVRARLEWIEA